MTDSNLPETENLEVDSKTKKKLITKENKNISVILDEKQNKDELKKGINIKTNNQPDKFEQTDINKKANDSNLVKNIDNTDKKDIIKRTRIQFGAFYSEKNVANLESKLAKIFKKEFGDDFGSFLVIKDEKHLKLILNTNSVINAKKICNYSKKNNINCLIIN